jgi:hypothetical protein
VPEKECRRECNYRQKKAHSAHRKGKLTDVLNVQNIAAVFHISDKPDSLLGDPNAVGERLIHAS